LRYAHWQQIASVTRDRFYFSITRNFKTTANGLGQGIEAMQKQNHPKRDGNKKRLATLMARSKITSHFDVPIHPA